MSKQELIDKAVHALGGKMPPEPHPDSKLSDFDGLYYIYEDEILIKLMNGSTAYNDLICSVSDYKKRARELGYINGYRWGVEYPTNGKKPDLDSSILVYVVDCHAPYSKEAQVIDIHWPRYDTFEIIDERYKPADTSYLDSVSEYTENNHEISAGLTGAECMDLAEEMFWQFDNLVSKTPENQRILFKQFLGAYHKRLVFAQNQRANDFLATDWYCYETQKALRLPPVGVECEVDSSIGWVKCIILAIANCKDNGSMLFWQAAHDCGSFYRASRFRPLDWNRKAEAERKRVVTEAQKVCVNFSSNDLGKLYDAGYLRLPADKS